MLKFHSNCFPLIQSTNLRNNVIHQHQDLLAACGINEFSSRFQIDHTVLAYEGIGHNAVSFAVHHYKEK